MRSGGDTGVQIFGDATGLTGLDVFGTITWWGPAIAALG